MKGLLCGKGFACPSSTGLILRPDMPITVPGFILRRLSSSPPISIFGLTLLSLGPACLRLRPGTCATGGERNLANSLRELAEFLERLSSPPVAKQTPSLQPGPTRLCGWGRPSGVTHAITTCAYQKIFNILIHFTLISKGRDVARGFLLPLHEQRGHTSRVVRD